MGLTFSLFPVYNKIQRRIPQINTFPKLYMSRKNQDSPKKYTKSNLPSKTCVVCGRPFSWRKKWSKVWDEVKYCSDRCRSSKSTVSITENKWNENSPLSNLQLSRKTMKKSLLIATTLSSQFINFKPIILNAIASVPIRPTKEEIENIFEDIDWVLVEEEGFKKSDFRRLDENDDSVFYTNPRFVEHIDQKAINSLTNYHGKTMLEYMTKRSLNSLKVLDLCSSWVSHIPNNIPINELVGVGMNLEELKENRQLTSYFVQDLNKNPSLSLKDQNFDIVLIQLSIDYLTKPVEVLKEVGRVLTKNGIIIITFSNRVFIDKAVAVWTGKSDLDHMETVGSYLYLTKKFDEKSIRALDLSPSVNQGDPLYAVIAEKN